MALVTKSAVSQKAAFAGRVAPVRPQVDIRQLYVEAWTLQRFLRDTACCHRRPQGACASVQQPAPGPPGSQETPSPLTWTQSEWPSPQIASNHCSRLGWGRRHRSWSADHAEDLCSPHSSWSDLTLATGCCQREAWRQTCGPSPIKAHTPVQLIVAGWLSVVTALFMFAVRPRTWLATTASTPCTWQPRTRRPSSGEQHRQMHPRQLQRQACHEHHIQQCSSALPATHRNMAPLQLVMLPVC